MTQLFIKSVETNFSNPVDDLVITAHVVNSADKPIAQLHLVFSSEIAFSTKFEILDQFDDAIRTQPIVNYAHLQLCIMNTLHRASNHETEIPYAPEIVEPLLIVID